MIKQVYDNRVDDILDYLRNRIIKEPFKEDIGPLVDNYLKMANIKIRTLEVVQKRDFEILKKLEKDLKYYKDQTNEIGLIAKESGAHKEYIAITKYLENFLREVNNGIY